uniref:DDE Tnp4 domain-containing protein n=1 Tax=Aegilops tauschii subsp. strangulata TaxID=200361 RepID=A0A453MX94_AEGTS
GTLFSLEDAQTFESVFKMTRRTFRYICSLVSLELNYMTCYTFADGRELSLQDLVAIVLRRLYSSEPPETIGSTVGVNESTVLLVTESFVAVLCNRAKHHLLWPDSSRMYKIKSMFDKIHNMNNCCGVICTTRIPFGPNRDSEYYCSVIMQVIIDPEMRFTNIWLASTGSMNPFSILHNSSLFNECQKGDLLNGNKLKVALDGSEVGEYIIGDVEYPLLPWLLTPYKEEELSDSKVEFNRRHSAATTCMLNNVLARFKGTWKYLQEETWWPVNPDTLSNIINACCILHNIVIDMEDDAAMPSSEAEDWSYHQQVRQLANEDAVRARDMLSQFFLARMSSELGEEDHELAATGSGDENKEQEAETKSAEEERQC